MKISFTETMRGELKDSSGKTLPVSFNVRITQVRGGAFTLRGVVNLPGYGDEAPCEGTFELSPRKIGYVVEWATRRGRFVLRGHKTPSLLAPMTSMRRLPIALEDERGARLAEGVMWFAVSDLPSFIASWLPVPTSSKRRFDARFVAVQRRVLVEGDPS